MTAGQIVSVSDATRRWEFAGDSMTVRFTLGKETFLIRASEDGDGLWVDTTKAGHRIKVAKSASLGDAGGVKLVPTKRSR